jgi:hypothetical protein
MNWPATREQLREAGYIDAQRSKFCSCGEACFWYRTAAGKWIPLSFALDGRFVPHHASCANVKNYRNAEKKLRDRTDPKKPVQGNLPL